MGAYFAFWQLEFSKFFFECDYWHTEKESDVAILLMNATLYLLTKGL